RRCLRGRRRSVCWRWAGIATPLRLGRQRRRRARPERERGGSFFGSACYILAVCTQTPQSPLGVFGDDWVFGSCEPFERFAKFCEAGVAHRERDVAEEAAILCAADWRVP